MEVKRGHKQTEIGVIPEDWNLMPFSHAIGTYIDYRGRTPRKLGLSWGGGDILALSANNVQMGRIDPDKEAYFGSEELYRKWMVQGECECGDVLLTMEAPLGNVAQISESDEPPSIEVKHSRMLLRVRPRTGEDKKKALVEEWYREQLKEAVPPLLARWQLLLDVRVHRFFVQRMKTKWGSCNPGTRSIRLNTDLAKKPRTCLEYIVVHEMIHLLEPTHNARFVAMMDRAMPQWRFYREQLNRLPVRHEEWVY